MNYESHSEWCAFLHDLDNLSPYHRSCIGHTTCQAEMMSPLLTDDYGVE